MHTHSIICLKRIVFKLCQVKLCFDLQETQLSRDAHSPKSVGHEFGQIIGLDTLITDKGLVFSTICSKMQTQL